MKPWALMVAFVLVLLPSRAWAVAPVRVALVIGTNVAVDRSLATLRFADDDAARYDELFRQLGAETIVLSRLDENTSRVHPNVAARARPPTRANLDAATSELAARLTRARGEGRPSEAYVVYAGHGRAREGRGYLTLEDTWISGEELHAAVQRVGADRTHVMIDACDAYLMAYSRGPGGARRPADPFRDPSALAKDPRVGLMLSTTSERETHEWERFHSGIFSHEVRSGLHGAADADRDGIVTYRELAAFVERANAAIPNERYRPRVHAHAPVGSDVILDLRGDLSTRRIEIGRGHATHFFIEDTRGVRLVDFHFGPQGGASLLRPSPGQGLYVRRADADEELEVSAELDVVELADLTPHVPRTSPRGAEQDAFSLIFALPFDTSVVDSYAQRGPPASETAPPAPPAGSSWMKTVGIAGIAAGGAALLTGATLGVFSLVERGGDTPQESGADAQRRSERVSTLGTGAVIGLAAGTAVLAGGIVLMVLTPRSGSRTIAGSLHLGASPRAGGGGIVLGGSF